MKVGVRSHVRSRAYQPVYFLYFQNTKQKLKLQVESGTPVCGSTELTQLYLQRLERQLSLHALGSVCENKTCYMCQIEVEITIHTREYFLWRFVYSSRSCLFLSCKSRHVMRHVWLRFCRVYKAWRKYTYIWYNRVSRDASALPNCIFLRATVHITVLHIHVPSCGPVMADLHSAHTSACRIWRYTKGDMNVFLFYLRRCMLNVSAMLPYNISNVAVCWFRRMCLQV